MKTETMDYQGMVAEFMRASGQVVNTEPTEMTTELAQLRYNLFIEEVQELKDAVEANDRVEQLDALCDILYIVMGTANSKGAPIQKLKDVIGFSKRPAAKTYDSVLEKLGMGTLIENLEDLSVEEVGPAVTAVVILTRLLGFSEETFDEAFRRVHVSNMSKFFGKNTTSEVINATVKKYADEGVETYLDQAGEYMAIYRHPDGKVLKSIEYKPVYLTDLV